MAQRIIDLDALLPEETIVRVAGEEYPLPGDIPVPAFLEISRLVDRLNGLEELNEGETQADVLQTLYERLMALFRITSPELEDLPIGAEAMGHIVVGIYGAEVADSDSPPRKAGGTRSTSKAKAKRSR